MKVLSASRKVLPPSNFEPLEIIAMGQEQKRGVIAHERFTEVKKLVQGFFLVFELVELVEDEDRGEPGILDPTQQGRKLALEPVIAPVDVDDEPAAQLRELVAAHREAGGHQAQQIDEQS